MKPPALKPGDRIAVVSPCSSTTPEKIAPGIALLQNRGYEAIVGKHAYDVDAFLAGADKDRAGDLMEAWFDPAIAGIMLSRGGYGLGRLLPFLDLDKMATSPKLLVGFSDATALHIALNRRGLVTLHAPMLLSFARERAPWVIDLWFQAMEGTAPISLPREAPRGETLIGGTVEAEVTGGCLCLLADSIGTPNLLETAGKILLIEDVDEHAYRVDAMLTHLLAARSFEGVAGIVVGEMTRTDEQADPNIPTKPWKQVVTERLKPLGVPMITGFPFGHAEHMASLPLGVKARLDADAGELTYMELGVLP
ncbi:MAG: LD-carboxypeptidase [Armatimonadota bacterium]|nr:LD-carboxypeptidase [Armatimonadota bacterium]